MVPNVCMGRGARNVVISTKHHAWHNSSYIIRLHFITRISRFSSQQPSCSADRACHERPDLPPFSLIALDSRRWQCIALYQARYVINIYLFSRRCAHLRCYYIKKAWISTDNRPRRRRRQIIEDTHSYLPHLRMRKVLQLSTSSTILPLSQVVFVRGLIACSSGIPNLLASAVSIPRWP